MAYTREQLGAALKKAHGAGDTASAQKLVGAIRALDAQGSQPSAPPEPVKRVNEFEPAPAPDIAGNNRMIPQPLQQPTQAPQTPGIGARASEGILRNDVGMRSQMREQDALEAQVPVNAGEERAASALNGFTLGQFPRAMGAGAGIGAAVAYPLTGGKIGNGQGYGEFVSNETEEARKKARLQVTRGREKRPLESMGLEVVPGFFTGKTAFDILTQGKKVGGFVRGVGSGTISGASYGLADRSNDVGNIEQRAIGDTGAVSNREVGGRDVALSLGIGAAAGGVLGGAAGKGIEVIGNRASGRVQGNLLGPGKINVGNLLDMELAGQPLSPKALNRVVSIIRKDGNLAPENVRGLFEAVQQRLGSMDVGQSERLTLGQALSEALERDYPQAARNIETALLNSRLSTRNNDSSPAIIGRVADDLRGSQSDFLSGSTKANLGDKSALSLSDELDAARSELGTQYEAIFAPGASVAPAGAVDDVNRAIQYWRNDTGLTQAAEKIAQQEGFKSGVPFADALDHYAKTDPRRTAHWMQSAAAGIVRREKAKPPQEQDAIKIRHYTSIRDNLLKPLEEATPGYSAVRSKFGSVEEIDTASNAGNTFFLKARNEGDLDKYIRDEIGALSPEARAAALASIRDKIGSVLRSGPQDAPARITQISSTGALDALEKLGPEGAKLADDIRFIRRENLHLGKFVPTNESATAKNLRAMKIGETLGGSGITSAMTPKAEGGGDIAALIRFGTNMAGKGINALAKPRVRTLEDTTRFLMARKGNIPSKPEGADFSPRFAAPGSLSQGADTANPVPSSAKQPVRGAGLSAIRSDAGNALAGGVVGGAMPADNNQDRARNIMIGAGGAGLAGRVGPRSANRGVRGQSFVGINSKDPAVIQRLTRAKEMEKAGASREEIWSETMSMKGADGKWRAEISDKASTYIPDTPAKTLGDMQRHDELYRSYPEMANAPANRINDVNPVTGERALEGSYDKGVYSVHDELGKTSGRKTTLHEGQHGIQDIEGFARGGNPSEHYPEEILQKIEDLRMLEDDLVRKSWTTDPEKKAIYMQKRSDVEQEISALRRQAGQERLDWYKRLSGEVEARGVEARRDLSMDQRRNRPAWMDEDVAREDQIVRFGGGASESRPPKIKSDIPLGTPPKGKAKLPKSLNEMMAEPVPMQGIAKATGDKKTVQKAIEAEAVAMVSAGKTSDEVFKKTGVHIFEHNGKRVLRRFPNRPDVKPDRARQQFYSSVTLPRDEQPKWVRDIVDEAETLVLNKPIPGTQAKVRQQGGKWENNPNGKGVRFVPDKGPVRGAGLLAIGGAGAVAANEGNALALPPRNEQGQFMKQPEKLRIGAGAR